MVKLYPPIIEKTLPAQYGNILKIPYDLNKAVNLNEFNQLSLIVKTTTTNKVILNNIRSQSIENNIAIFEIPSNLSLTVGQFYKAQIAFVAVGEEKTIGYYSEVGVFKYTSENFKISIDNLSSLGASTEQDFYIGRYEHSEDIAEKIDTYCFSLYDINNNLLETTGLVVHDNSMGTEANISLNKWQPSFYLQEKQQYIIQYTIVTVNNLSASVSYIVQKNLYEYEVKVDGLQLRGKMNDEEGYVDLFLQAAQSPSHLLNYFITVFKTSSKTNYQQWEKITNIQIEDWYNDIDRHIYRDFLLEQGETYKYAYAFYNGNMYSKKIELDQIFTANFEDMFLFDGNKQLKLRFNPKVSSFKNTILEQKIDTIGGKYPFFFRNGNVKYKEFPISGLISMLMDDNELFITGLKTKDTLTRDKTPAFIDQSFVPGDTQLTANNYCKERQFKLEVLDWLTNGKPKLFRSPTEGNYIVRLMNTSLTPNDTLGRMLHTFNCTAYEIAECNQQNLASFQLVNLETQQIIEQNRVVSASEIDLSSTSQENYSDFIYQFDMNNENSKAIIFEKGLGTSILTLSLIDFPIGTVINFIGLDSITIGLTKEYHVPLELVTKIKGIYLNNHKQGKLIFSYYTQRQLTEFDYIYQVYSSGPPQIRMRTMSKLGKQMINDNADFYQWPSPWNYFCGLQDIQRRVGHIYYLKLEAMPCRIIYVIDGNRYYDLNAEIPWSLNENMQEGILYDLHIALPVSEEDKDKISTKYYDSQERDNIFWLGFTYEPGNKLRIQQSQDDNSLYRYSINEQEYDLTPSNLSSIEQNNLLSNPTNVIYDQYHKLKRLETEIKLYDLNNIDSIMLGPGIKMTIIYDEINIIYQDKKLPEMLNVALSSKREQDAYINNIYPQYDKDSISALNSYYQSQYYGKYLRSWYNSHVDEWNTKAYLNEKGEV